MTRKAKWPPTQAEMDAELLEMKVERINRQEKRIAELEAQLATARADALEEAARVADLYKVQFYQRIPLVVELADRIRALETSTDRQAVSRPPESAPCGGTRCHLYEADGTWIHSSKSYGTCSVLNEEKP
jgi:hypothetical protein